LKKIDKTINNLLDNIASVNREFADRRLGELQLQKQQLEARLKELDRLSLSQEEITGIVSDSMKLLAGLESVLRERMPQEKPVAPRQCFEKIVIDKPNAAIGLSIYRVAVGNPQATQECRASVWVKSPIPDACFCPDRQIPADWHAEQSVRDLAWVNLLYSGSEKFQSFQ
jgi:hypothetical protein